MRWNSGQHWKLCLKILGILTEQPHHVITRSFKGMSDLSCNSRALAIEAYVSNLVQIWDLLIYHSTSCIVPVWTDKRIPDISVSLTMAPFLEFSGATGNILHVRLPQSEPFATCFLPDQVKDNINLSPFRTCNGHSTVRLRQWIGKLWDTPFTNINRNI